MDPFAPSDAPATGTLPVSGQEQALGATQDSGQGAVQRPAWVDEARAAQDGRGRSLAYEVDGHRVVLALEQESTRIGRSLAADVRFDDATVSRRHALVVCQADGVRVLDDRSLNGVYVNGERVELRALGDGDRIAIGRHTLWFLDTTGVASGEAAAPVSAAD
jgi:pSer/pThr/pTyr-binding forkhead associated (FHA) protein